MKTYHLYVFTQDGCGPCQKLKDYVTTRPQDDQKELDFVPLKTKSKQQPYAPGSYTALAAEHDIELSPTLLVVHEEQWCKFEPDEGYEFCDNKEVEVERFVGANEIIEHLDVIIESYTYAHPE